MNELNLNQINSELKKTCPEKNQYFFGHGKLLLTGEYFVLDGALALALPTKVGQSLSVKYTPSFSPTLSWKSFDVKGNCWFDSKFEFWHFKCLDENPSEEALFLQKILQQVRKQNSHFLRDGVDVKVETHLGFPLAWGLGSSSSLIYNIAQWAYISPFELLFKTHGGSGYDIACAQSDGPIAYKKITSGPNWSPIYFHPSFRDNIYFIYLGKKQNSRDAVAEYSTRRPIANSLITKITELTQEFLNAQTLKQFQAAMITHENLVGESLEMTPVKDLMFSDFNGAVKSLGAWGGDFVMVATEENLTSVKSYFSQKGLDVVYSYDDLISGPLESLSKDSVKMGFSNHLIH
ncbi:MAG: GYDIA family GHMP kinase [Bacteriovorax sp.]|nr:GYDIA family GHMP kinase [Bacteriovorax sp.]